MNIKQDLEALDDSQLLYEHHEVHKAFSIWKRDGKYTDDAGGSWKKEDFYNRHKLLLEKMVGREFEHNVQDELDQLKMGCTTCEEEMESPVRSEVGKEVTLEEVMGYIKPFNVPGESIALTGDIVDEGRTADKISIYMPESNSTSFTRYNLTNMFPKELQSRVEFVDDKPEGSYIPLYGLVYQLNEPVIKVSVMSITPDSIQPGNLFKALNPDVGRKNTVFSVESLKKRVRSYPVCVQEKMEGVRIQIHKWNGLSRVLTADGVDVSHRMPTLISRLSKDYYPDLVLDGYVSHGEGEEKSFLMGKDNLVEGEDKKLEVTVTDVLLWKTSGGAPIHRTSRRSIFS